MTYQEALTRFMNHRPKHVKEGAPGYCEGEQKWVAFLPGTTMILTVEEDGSLVLLEVTDGHMEPMTMWRHEQVEHHTS